VDLTTSERGVVDLKSSAKAWNQDRADTATQLTFYSMLKRAKTGADPAFIRVENLILGKNIRHLSIDTTRDHRDYTALFNRINQIIKGIDAEIYTPATDGAWWCSRRWCGYHDTCPYVKGKNGISTSGG
jgi:hypothetical protein